MKKELKNTDFDKNTIASELNLTGIMQCSSLHELINKLNVNRHYNKIEPLGSIMNYGEICSCDTGYLCEHRLQWIIDFIKNK